MFFIQVASTRIVDQSVKSMMRCLQLHPFTINLYTTYAHFLMTPSHVDPLYSANNESIFRTTSIIMLLNDISGSLQHISQLIRIMNAMSNYAIDAPFVLVFAQYIGRHILNGRYSIFTGDTPLITNVVLVKYVFSTLHRLQQLYIRPDKDWNGEYKVQVILLRNLFSRISLELRADKLLMLHSGYFYPDGDFSTYIDKTLLDDLEMQEMLRSRRALFRMD